MEHKQKINCTLNNQMNQCVQVTNAINVKKI